MAKDKSRTPIIGFIHVYTVNNWVDILLEQIERVHNSGLWDKTEKIYIGFVGSDPEEKISQIQFDKSSKVKKMFHMEDPELNDSLTLAMLHQKAMSFNGNIFYIHSKGVSHHGTRTEQAQTDWRHYMEHFIIEKHEVCFNLLNSADLVGVNWVKSSDAVAKSKLHGKLVYQPVTPHLSGNFFWATSTYIRTLPRLFPIQGRYDCEFWAGRGHEYTVAELWNSGAKHHRNEYPEHLYKDKSNIIYYDGEE